MPALLAAEGLDVGVGALYKKMRTEMHVSGKRGAPNWANCYNASLLYPEFG